MEITGEVLAVLCVVLALVSPAMIYVGRISQRVAGTESKAAESRLLMDKLEDRVGGIEKGLALVVAKIDAINNNHMVLSAKLDLINSSLNAKLNVPVRHRREECS